MPRNPKLDFSKFSKDFREAEHHPFNAMDIDPDLTNEEVRRWTNQNLVEYFYELKQMPSGRLALKRVDLDVIQRDGMFMYPEDQEEFLQQIRMQKGHPACDRRVGTREDDSEEFSKMDLKPHELLVNRMERMTPAARLSAHKIKQHIDMPESIRGRNTTKLDWPISKDVFERGERVPWKYLIIGDSVVLDKSRRNEVGNAQSRLFINLSMRQINEEQIQVWRVG